MNYSRTFSLPDLLLIQFLIFRSLNVEKIYKINHSNIPSRNDQRVFLIYADLILVKYICDHINAEISGKENRIKFFIILIPRKLFSVMQLLEEEGVYEHVIVYSFPWELIPLSGESILSLELKQCFNQLFVHGNQSLLPVAAKSLWSAFLLWGTPSVRVSIGAYSQSVCEMIDTYNNLLMRPEQTNSDINCCIIVDRDTDYLSTLLTPVTYTSLLDEVFGTQSGFVELNDDLVIPLDKQEIYLQIKNRHFSHVISFLKDKVKRIQEEFEKCQRMEVKQIKEYVKKDLINITEQKKALSNHISACEMIIKRLGNHYEKLIDTEESILQNFSRLETLSYIEDCIAMNIVDKYSILRLMCLLSITQNGIPLEKLNELKSQFLNAYGYKYLPIFHNLEKIGLLVTQPSFSLVDTTTSTLSNKMAKVVQSMTKSSVQQMIQKLKLTPTNKDTSDLKTSSNMSYVFSGSYVPAICKLVQMLHSSDIVKEDIPKIFPVSKVETFNETPTFNTFFVYFVGGVTYAEVAAFQLFEKLTGCQVIVGATNTINGNIVCDSCFS